MAIHQEALALAARPRAGRRRLTNEISPTSGLPAVVLRVGLILLALGLMLLIASTLAMAIDSESALFAFAAGAAAVVCGSLAAALSAR